MIVTPVINSIEATSASSAKNGSLAASAVKDIDIHPLASHYRGEKLLKLSKTSRIDPKLVCLLNPKSPTAESYYRLRHSMEKLREDDKRGVVVGVTSPSRGEGKTITAINLAGALAQNPGASVLLIDLDLRSPGTAIREYLDIKATGSGMVEWIQNAAMLPDQAGHYIPEFNMYLMASDAHADAPYELLRSPRLDEFLEAARQRYDFVIVDTSHVLNLPDVQLLSRIVDGFLIVIKADSTPRKMLEETLDMMEEEKVIGLVFNGASIAG